MSSFGDLKADVIDDAHGAYGVDDEKAARYLNECYERVCIATRITRRTTTLSLVAGQRDYSIATDFGVTDLAVITSIATPNAYPTRQPDYVSVSYGDMLRIRAYPEVPYARGRFHLYGPDTLMLYPTPAAGDTLTLAYVSRPAPMVLDDEEPDALPSEYHYVLVAGALERAARRKNPDEARRFGQDYAMGVADLRQFLATQASPTQTVIRVGYPAREAWPRVFGDQDTGGC